MAYTTEDGGLNNEQLAHEMCAEYSSARVLRMARKYELQPARQSKDAVIRLLVSRNVPAWRIVSMIENCP